MPQTATKRQLTITLPPALIQQMRTAVSQTTGLTLASLVEHGVRAYVRRLERQRGRRFQPREIRLKAGRPKNGLTRTKKEDRT